MKNTLRFFALLIVLCLAIAPAGCGDSHTMKVTFVNQTDMPVNMYVSGQMCTMENQVLDRSMRHDQFKTFKDKYREEFEVAVNNQVLVRKSLNWKPGLEKIMVVYNGSDIIISE